VLLLLQRRLISSFHHEIDSHHRLRAFLRSFSLLDRRARCSDPILQAEHKLARLSSGPSDGDARPERIRGEGT